ncbi:MAG TPA: GIY-YIG nuclease family protein [Burkholderiales bacterium]|nr:GIY-YIG nuclease family protein [Burkholderiales bacterium]
MQVDIEDKKNFKLKGIYGIVNILNNKIYIGSTLNSFYDRFKKHKNLLLKNKHPNKYLQNSVNKHGINNFKFFIIEIEDNIEIIRFRESFYIDNKNSVKKGYNISNQTTCPPSNKEIRLKISETLKHKHKNDCVFRQEFLKLAEKRKGKPSWNKGLICSNISNARKKMFDDIEVYDNNMKYFGTFSNPVEIEKYSKSKKNDLPIPILVEHLLFNHKDKSKKRIKKYFVNNIIYSQNIHRAIRNNTTYKGLFFKKVPYNSNVIRKEDELLEKLECQSAAKL